MTTSPLQPTGTPQGQPAPAGSSGGPFAAPAPYSGAAPASDERTMAMLCHLLGIFTGFLGPLIIWLIKKDSSPFVDDQGKEALNFQITVIIGYVAAFVLSFVLIGFLIGPAVFVLSVVFCVLATMKANSGVAYRYPLNIRFIR